MSGFKHIIEWFYHCIFRFILMVLGWKIAGRAGRDEKLDKLLSNKETVIQFQTEDTRSVTHFTFSGLTVRSRGGAHHQPALIVGFSSAKGAVETLMNGDMNSFLAAIQNKTVKVSGDYSLLMWFMSVVKNSVVKKSRNRKKA